MNTSLNWIKAMVPGLECTDQEFRDAMTLSGTKVECFNELDKNLDKTDEFFARAMDDFRSFDQYIG